MEDELLLSLSFSVIALNSLTASQLLMLKTLIADEIVPQSDLDGRLHVERC